jgi:hypothetical protein
MERDDRIPAHAVTGRQRLILWMAVACAALGVAVSAILLASAAAGKPHRLVSRLVDCTETAIIWPDAGGPPPRISGGPEIHLPGGGRLRCGQLVETGGSAPMAVVVYTGTVGLSARLPGNPVVTQDVMSFRLAGLSFHPGHEYVVSLPESPNRATMVIYTRSAPFVVLHFVFGHP